MCAAVSAAVCWSPVPKYVGEEALMARRSPSRVPRRGWGWSGEALTLMQMSSVTVWRNSFLAVDLLIYRNTCLQYYFCLYLNQIEILGSDSNRIFTYKAWPVGFLKLCRNQDSSLWGCLVPCRHVTCLTFTSHSDLPVIVVTNSAPLESPKCFLRGSIIPCGSPWYK